MAILKITSIVCEVPEENDKDEIYLVFNEKKIWPAKKYIQIDYDEVIQLSLEMKVSKPGTVKLELMEYDLASANDHLGTFFLEFENLNPSVYTDLLVRDEAGAKRASYYLNWGDY